MEKSKFNYTEANEIDLVEYIGKLGHQPCLIRGNDYWFISPFRNENTASFKVNKSKNVWYDHGIGKGGKLLDFICILNNCSVKEAMQKIEQQAVRMPLAYQPKLPSSFKENKLQIVSIKDQISDLFLWKYLKQRNIDLHTCNKFCKEVLYQNNERIYTAIGFKNNSGGYELRSEYFKGSTSPKFVSFFDHKANSISVFEGFFDFLTYQTIHRNQEQPDSNFLVLNSLSFLERSLLLMEKHDKIHLFLDNDDAGKKSAEQVMNRSNKVIDESILYKGYKDLNEWSVNFGKMQKLGHHKRVHL